MLLTMKKECILQLFYINKSLFNFKLWETLAQPLNSILLALRDSIGVGGHMRLERCICGKNLVGRYEEIPVCVSETHHSKLWPRHLSSTWMSGLYCVQSQKDPSNLQSIEQQQRNKQRHRRQKRILFLPHYEFRRKLT